MYEQTSFPRSLRRMEFSRNRPDRTAKKQSDSSGLSSSLRGNPELAGRLRPSVVQGFDATQIGSRRNKEAVDFVFQSLLADANADLANLLRDVNAWPQKFSRDEARNSSVSDLLVRAIRCAAKQYMIQAELGSLALTDELTGLYNRRGFEALAERQLKLARRNNRDLLLFFIDLDGLKKINDSFGHREGDLALKRTACILRSTFRDSDILSRLGGDEFGALAVETSAHSEASIRARLQKYPAAVNSREQRYGISISIGVARFDHRNPLAVRDLMTQADRAMYQEKRRRSLPSLVTEVKCLS